MKIFFILLMVPGSSVAFCSQKTEKRLLTEYGTIPEAGFDGGCEEKELLADAETVLRKD